MELASFRLHAGTCCISRSMDKFIVVVVGGGGGGGSGGTVGLFQNLLLAQ